MKKKIIASVLIIVLLTAAYFMQPYPQESTMHEDAVTGNVNEAENEDVPVQQTPEDDEKAYITEILKTAQNSEFVQVAEKDIAVTANGVDNTNVTTENEQQEAVGLPVSTDKTETVNEIEPEMTEHGSDAETQELSGDASRDSERKAVDEIENVCTLSISCSKVFSYMDKLKENKKSIIPDDGMILHETEVVFEEDETVFNVLRRTLKQKKIHLEFSATPIYNSMYIEGIGNLYEFDCGEMSGWTYYVNGKMPSYSCSEYQLSPGDRIEFVYTCDISDFSFETE